MYENRHVIIHHASLAARLCTWRKFEVKITLSLSFSLQNVIKLDYIEIDQNYYVRCNF